MWSDRRGIATIPAFQLNPDALKGHLRSCGYRPNLLRTDFRYGDNAAVPLVGFAQIPMDSRSACLAVLAAREHPRIAVEECRPIGAPIVFVCFQDTLQWWKQGATSAEWIESIPLDHIDGFFQSHEVDFSPDAIYRAKTLGRVRSEYQLSFVDVGLMPLVEEEVGKALGRLIERTVSGLKTRLGWSDVTDDQGHWLLKSVFWLVSGKILRDKEVPHFEDIVLTHVDDVFARVAKHYGSNHFSAGSKQKREALEESAEAIDKFSSLALTTTESLAYVYENTLISKATRAALGTHSTPSYLVDYIVGNLADWIAEIPENDRSVFEPACGHAAFLVSAMRLLTQLLPPEKSIPSRRGPYLRSRLHGTERDPFALELARLSLTLTDIPNPDGWDLRPEDMFVGDRLADQMSGTTILLANPPFERFRDEELKAHAKAGTPIVVNNKAAEMLRRTLSKLQPGGVFGVVVPQSILHGTSGEALRRHLIEHFEVREISLFPDKVFSFSEAESAVIMGRRIADHSGTTPPVRFRRIRGWQINGFRESYSAPSTRVVEQSRFNAGNHWDLRIPDLEPVWLALADYPRATEFAEIGKGLDFRGRDLPPGTPTYSDQEFSGGLPGYIRLERGLQLHELPKLHWMNLADDAVSSKRTGVTVKVPQVLMSYARVSRGPWRLKALIDRAGRPVTSRFLTVRPKACSLEVLWALLNSPVANAHAFTHLEKRDNLVSEVQRIPVPKGTAFDEIETIAREYLDAAKSGLDPARLHGLMMQVDAAVLRQYALPVGLEQTVLSLFTGWNRVGVPFTQDRYFPPELTQPISLSDFVKYESDWPSTNRRRGKLVDREINGKNTNAETAELASLQAYADYFLDKVSPRPTDLLQQLEDRFFGSKSMKTKGG